MAGIEEVKQYWEKHPLYGYELENIGSKEFFDNIDRIKREDVERFALKYWEFDKFRDRLVSDIGCGPGWLTVNYASNGARVYAIDLTSRAVSLTTEFLRYYGLRANVGEGNAEDLVFKDNFFDLVVASGVLHHTPDIFRAMKEVYRVLKPGGKAKLTLYYKGILHKKLIFTIVRIVMGFLRIKHPGVNLSKEARDIDDFIRQYDGINNPIGIGKTHKEWGDMLKQAGFIINSHQLHFFPRRFIPFKKVIPRFIHWLLDKYLGTMVYFDLHKPAR